MDRPTCRTCPYWEHDPNRTLEDLGEIGKCHRYPPTRATTEEQNTETACDIGGTTGLWMGWNTLTIDKDWCREHPDFPAYLASLKEATAARSTTG